MIKKIKKGLKAKNNELLRRFISYESSYGGQSLKVTGAEKAFIEIIKFLNKFTYFKEPESFNISIYLPKKDENGYDSRELEKEAEKFLGKGKKLIWKSHISNPLDQEYKIEWDVPFSIIQDAISFLDKKRRLHTHYIGPVNIRFSISFLWKDESGMLLPNQKSENNQIRNNITFFLSKKNSINMTLIFPYEEITSEFINLQKNIIKYLHVTMPFKNYRIWIPNKNESSYNIRKINFMGGLKWE